LKNPRYLLLAPIIVEGFFLEIRKWGTFAICQLEPYENMYEWTSGKLGAVHVDDKVKGTVKQDLEKYFD
jgi:hypothetical protein